MKNQLFRKIASICCAALLLCASTGCQRSVVLTPGEDDLVVLNGCVVSACNYLAVVKTQHTLDQNFWAKILLVRFENHPAGHAYCVWETEGNVYGYDRNSGAFPIPVYTRDPRAIAIVLAQELSRILKEPLAVSQAEFVNSNESKLYTFGSLEQSTPASPIALFAQLAPLSQP
ncbi:MAG: hypothetical protein QOH88_1070 [Verrucomicrobiota bacterium]|jgi:hypothetical protein